MIINLDYNNKDLIKSVENKFNTFENQDIIIENDIKFNPYINYLIYMNNDEPIGYISYSDIYDRYEINNFCVLREYRRKNIGTTLLRSVVDRARQRGTKNITLEVRKDNVAAISLYEKEGFLIKSIRSKYYGNIDGILMEKEMI